MRHRCVILSLILVLFTVGFAHAETDTTTNLTDSIAKPKGNSIADLPLQLQYAISESIGRTNAQSFTQQNNAFSAHNQANQATIAHPLQTLFALLPAPLEAMLLTDDPPRISLSYVDLQLLRQRYPYDQLLSPQSRLATVASLASDVAENIFIAEMNEMPTVTGFSLSDIRQILVFGEPPARVAFLRGEFDGDAIRAAFTAAGYAIDPSVSAYTRICHPEGCTESTKTDLRERNLGIPFGGEIGRKDALALFESDVAGEDLLITTPNDELFEAAVAQASSGVSSTFSHPVWTTVGALLEQPLAADMVAANLYPARWLNSTGDEPAYAVLAAATYAPEDALTQTLVMQVYPQVGVEALSPFPIETLLAGTSVFAKRSYAELFAERGVAVTVESSIAIGEGSARLLRLSANSTPTVDYELLMRLIFNRDLAWLAP